MISVIIPTVNEAAHLPGTLEALRAQRDALDLELDLVVVDGGSEDETVALAMRSGCRVIASERRDRAHQLNLGAAAAVGEVFWFLHADTWVDPRSTRSMRRALRDPAVVGGGFKRRFRSPSPLLLFTSMLASLRSRFWGLYFGDQSLYVRREAFLAVGGFPDVPLFEDFGFCQRLKPIGRLRCLGPAVRSSARRFEKRGALAVTLSDLWLTLRYQGGASPEALWRGMRQG